MDKYQYQAQQQEAARQKEREANRYTPPATFNELGQITSDPSGQTAPEDLYSENIVPLNHDDELEAQKEAEQNGWTGDLPRDHGPLDYNYERRGRMLIPAGCTDTIYRGRNRERHDDAGNLIKGGTILGGGISLRALLRKEERRNKR